MNGRFTNEDKDVEGGFSKVLRWQLTRNPQKKEKKADPFRLKVIENKAISTGKKDKIVWLGHATFFIRKIVVEYPQGWLATKVENKQADWRTDPARSGVAGCMGDIGTHAENLAEYITGLKITQMCADLTTFVEGRRLDDDGNVLLRFENGAKGVLHASQISVGEENGLNIRIYGEKGGLKWRQEEPNTLIATWLDQPAQTLRTGVGSQYESTRRHIRIPPPGHPEGYLEAFGNLYRNFAITLRSRLKGEIPFHKSPWHPDKHTHPLLVFLPLHLLQVKHNSWYPIILITCDLYYYKSTHVQNSRRT